MNDIQHARDLLAKWRNEPSPWNDPSPLIVGTAGNPDLLDALDLVLARGEAARDGLLHDDGRELYRMATAETADIVAAAIVAADERMNA